MASQIKPFISEATFRKTTGIHSCSIQGVTANFKQFMGTPSCRYMYPVNVMGTPTCLSVYPINDMRTHQYRLCTQLKIDKLLLISKHELLIIHGCTQLLVRVLSNVRVTSTCLSVHPENDMDTHQYRLCTQLKIETLWLFLNMNYKPFMGTPNC